MSKNRICNFQGCYTQPIYNYKGIKKGIFCSVHKLDGMINVKDRKCEYIECNKIPNFNILSNYIHLYPKCIHVCM